MDTEQTTGGKIGQFDAPSIDTASYGKAYDPTVDEPEIRLNLTAPDLGRFLDEQAGKINTARRVLDLAFQQIVNTYGDLNDPATWAKVAADENMGASVNEAIGNAAKAARIVDMNATAANRETTSVPLRISEKEMQAAAVLMPLAQVEVSTLPLPELRDLLRFAISQDDRAAQYVYARLLPARLDSGAAQSSDGTVRRSDGDKRVSNEIRDMLTVVREQLKDRSLSDLNQRAQTLRSNASALKRLAATRRNATATTPEARAYEQATGRKLIRVQ